MHFDVVVLGGVGGVEDEDEEGGGVGVDEGMLDDDDEIMGGPHGSVDSRFFAT